MQLAGEGINVRAPALDEDLGFIQDFKNPPPTRVPFAAGLPLPANGRTEFEIAVNFPSMHSVLAEPSL